MQNLDEKIAVYEKQITDLQNKLEVLETIVPAQDEAWHLRQAIKEKDTEIDLLKSNAVKHGSTSIAPVEQVNEEAVVLQKTVEQLKEENAGLLKKIKEQEIELAQKKRLLDNIYHELDAFTINKTAKTAAQTFL